VKLAALTEELVEQAVTIYQDLAYGSVVPTSSAVTGADGGAGPLGRFHREQVESVPGHSCQRYSMRLGNRNYPFMKLLLQEHLVAGEFFFAVDTHDQMDVGAGVPDFDQWQAVRVFNAELKRRIESSFEQAGIDTAAAVRRQIVATHRADGSPCRGLVLIVDDEEDLAEAVDKLIQRAGFRTCIVHDGRAALAAARELQPDLILLDYELPELDGLQVIDALRSYSETRRMPVLLNSSARISLTDIQRADGFLSKPFTEGLLNAMINRVLDKNTASERRPT